MSQVDKASAPHQTLCIRRQKPYALLVIEAILAIRRRPSASSANNRLALSRECVNLIKVGCRGWSCGFSHLAITGLCFKEDYLDALFRVPSSTSMFTNNAVCFTREWQLTSSTAGEQKSAKARPKLLRGRGQMARHTYIIRTVLHDISQRVGQGAMRCL